MDTDNDNNVDVALLFQKPVDTAFELVKTFCIEQKEELNENETAVEPETKFLQPLNLKPSSESGGSSSSECGLPEEVLNEPLVDDVFEDSTEDVATDLLFRQPKEREVELVYTIQTPENQLEDDVDSDGKGPEEVVESPNSEENVAVDLLFRKPTDTSFELIYTIPLMEDVAVVNPEEVLAQVLEAIPPPEELDNVVEAVEEDVSEAEFTFSPVKQPSGDEETVTAEVVTVLERPKDDDESEEARDVIEKVVLTSEDTFDDVDDPKEEEAFQNFFVKSVETPPPEEDVPGEETEGAADDVGAAESVDTDELVRKLAALADEALPVDETEGVPEENVITEVQDVVPEAVDYPINDTAPQDDTFVGEERQDAVLNVDVIHEDTDSGLTEEADAAAEVVRKLSAMADEPLPVDQLEDVLEDVSPREEEVLPDTATDEEEQVPDVDGNVDGIAVEDEGKEEFHEIAEAAEVAVSAEIISKLSSLADAELPVDNVDSSAAQSDITEDHGDPDAQTDVQEVKERGEESLPVDKLDAPSGKIAEEEMEVTENPSLLEEKQTTLDPVENDDQSSADVVRTENNVHSEDAVTEVAISTQVESEPDEPEVAPQSVADVVPNDDAEETEETPSIPNSGEADVENPENHEEVAEKVVFVSEENADYALDDPVDDENIAEEVIDPAEEEVVVEDSSVPDEPETFDKDSEDETQKDNESATNDGGDQEEKEVDKPSSPEDIVGAGDVNADDELDEVVTPTDATSYSPGDKTEDAEEEERREVPEDDGAPKGDFKQEEEEVSDEVNVCDELPEEPSSGDHDLAEETVDVKIVVADAEEPSKREEDKTEDVAPEVGEEEEYGKDMESPGEAVDVTILTPEAEQPTEPVVEKSEHIDVGEEDANPENLTKGETESRPAASKNVEESDEGIADLGQIEQFTVQSVPEDEPLRRAKRSQGPGEPEVIGTEEPSETMEETFEKVTTSNQESSAPVPHRITDVHFEIPKDHPDFGNDYVPFGTEPSEYPSKTAEFNVADNDGEEEEDVVAELSFQPIRQWKDEDVISLQSLKSLVAEVGCTTEEHKNEEETLKILKVVPSEPSLMELDIANDPNVIHVPIPLMEPATKYLEDMVDWIIADAVKEVGGEMEVVTESELCEMKEESPSCPIPEPLEDMEFPFEGAEVDKMDDDEKTPEPEMIPEAIPETPTIPEVEESIPTPVPVAPIESAPIPQRPPRAPKQEPPPKSRVRFGPLSIKLGKSYSEEQKALEEMLERPLEVIISSSQAAKRPEEGDDGALSPLSPGTLAEYEHVPMMDMRSVPHSPQEKPEEEPEKEAEETRILGVGKSVEDVGKPEDEGDEEEEEGSEYLDSIGDLSERTIQRFNTSLDDPSVRRDSFSSISSFGDRQKFQTAIESIRHDLLPFQSSVSQYLVPSANPTQLVANLSMDSPSDLSPNAPPVGFENTAQFLEKLQAEDRPSAEGSIDSSGFEKVDHEGLEDYPPVADPMQQSVFGSLQAPADDDVATTVQSDDGFVLIDKTEAEIEGSGGGGKKMSSHDDVIEKNYFGEDTAASATAKLLESPIAEEARKLVQDAVASASEISKQAVDDADEIGKELLDSAEHKLEDVKEPVLDALQHNFDDVKEPVVDTLQKAHDGLGDFVHETVPQTVEDFVQNAHAEAPAPVFEKPASPVAEKAKTPEPPLLNIHDTVDQVHDEIDSFLRGRDPTPPLEADEDAQEQPHFGNQTPEEDETTFDRKGPLTIPEEVEKAAAQKKEDDFSDFDPLVTANTGAAFGAALGEALTEEEMFGHQKFETVPRPPTPPKDISDEDVKPSTVNLGPAHHHSHPSSPHHSILKHHGEAWVDFKTVPPCVLDVIYWRDAKKSAVVLSLALLALFILAKYPLLTVITYSLLLSLVAAAGFRVFKKVESQIKKTDAEHPFSEILAQDLSLPQEKVHAQADVLVEHATCVANKLKKLVFVESPVESVKFGVVLWALTYVASWFSGFTIAILALLGVFSVPKVYESNQEAIDPHLETISGHIKNVQNLIDEKLPFLRSAPVAAEEKKDQ